MVTSVIDSVAKTIAQRGLADSGSPTLLMVSGGSDSTALAYIACELRERGVLGPLGIMHFNHKLRAEASEGDAAFVRDVAQLLDVPFFYREADIGALAQACGGNVEAVAREERFAAAAEALAALCESEGVPLAEGRVFTAHSLNDRAENFYMRSIVGTGPGGFRSMSYITGNVAHPLLDCTREELRAYLRERAASGLPVQRDAAGALWREDATNACTDRLRSFVRSEMIPRAEQWNPQLLATLGRTMNQIADEDDFLAQQADQVYAEQVAWTGAPDAAEAAQAPAAPAAGCRLLPAFGVQPLVLKRRVVYRVLKEMLGYDSRVEAAAIQAVLAAFDSKGAPCGGYVANIQGNLAISANKQGVRIEPMSAFRARRKRG